ncbi:5-methyltetrahydropteroyltriglutamate--homocysteine methyltransferase [Dendrobium catenatum]|uniref:5-methyltetrahydropteroyltriglutamate--homocysteine S-methyltransferase n=1 Tax=Dendrobium catenatum TaxID=906689 RepID=A0A2I0WC68_9ASPA|nr:5-methyltetrahydropteroyltriglutamate--homocysteine methyltransferase [Dendrobium catenatum]
MAALLPTYSFLAVLSTATFSGISSSGSSSSPQKVRALFAGHSSASRSLCVGHQSLLFLPLSPDDLIASVDKFFPPNIRFRISLLFSPFFRFNWMLIGLRVFTTMPSFASVGPFVRCLGFGCGSGTLRAFSLRSGSRNMASHIVGYPRMGPKRELKFALESFWDGKSTAEDLQKVAANLRSSIWKQMADAGIKYIPSNTFSYYDQVLDTTATLGAVPERYSWNGGEIGFDTYFSMARGNASVPAMEMTKWFDTNYHFIVPELGPNTKFSYASHKAVSEYNEAKSLGIDTVPVLVGPVTYLLLSKPAKGVAKTFPLLSLLDHILPIYKQVIAELKAAGASWIQFDEPTLVKDLDSHQLEAFAKAYTELESSLSGLNVVIETYFADVPVEAYKTIIALNAITGFGFDLVRGNKTLDVIKSVGFPSGKYLFAGIVDGRNIWANDLAASLSTLQDLGNVVGKDKLVVSTSSSLLHTAVDLVNETKLDDEIKSWLAFAAQKVVEVNALAKALSGQKDEDFFSANAAAQASRKASPRVTNPEVQKAAAALKGSEHRRATNVSVRLDAQQKKLNLPILPTTTIGSFPQTIELRRVRREYKANKISEEEYVNAIKDEINKVVKIQEELDIDVLVHGEPERNDMVEYFGEQLSGFAFTVNGWVQSYGSRCVKPPIIYGDVSRPKAMTVFWSSLAQSMTSRPMKGMLTGPVTILNWSFVRNDQPRFVYDSIKIQSFPKFLNLECKISQHCKNSSRFETCYQIALSIKQEVEDLEAAGINVIQIDEAALREGLPLRKSEEAFYLEWAVHSFRITNCGVKDTTQIHTHMCYSNFNDIILSIIDMDADVITIENSRSDEKLLSVFREGVKYGAGIGPGVYDIHSPRIPSTEEIADRIRKMLAVLETNILWVNPDCGLKTRKYTEVKPALTNLVAAAKQLRTELANTK